MARALGVATPGAGVRDLSEGASGRAARRVGRVTRRPRRYFRAQWPFASYFTTREPPHGSSTFCFGAPATICSA